MTEQITGEQINEMLEDGMYDASPISELETQEAFNSWVIDGYGYVIWNDDVYAKCNALDESDYLIYKRVGDGWMQY